MLADRALVGLLSAADLTHYNTIFSIQHVLDGIQYNGNRMNDECSDLCAGMFPLVSQL
jgi:hypothetical protein